MIEIIGMQRIEDTIWRTGGSGDNWHMTWAMDDRQYTGLCDGEGWPGIEGWVKKSYNTRVLAVTGDTGAEGEVKFHDLPGFPELLSEAVPMISRYYSFGIIALDSYIYHFLSTPNHHFYAPDPYFCGIKMIYSPDLGKTWCNQHGGPVRWEDWEERNRDNMLFFEEGDGAFALLTVLQMGKNYEHNRDGYVYVCAPNGKSEGTMNQLVMFRVKKERLLDRSAYEYFAERKADGSARWSSSIADRAPVHTFPAGWVNTQIHPYAWHPSMVYNAPLGVYMMCNWGMGCAPDGMWFGKPSYLGFWTAPQPWGPWTQVHEETAWMPGGDVHARAYQPQILPKWLAPDGKSFWLAYTDFQPEQPGYCFNCQKVEVETR
jgi:hypothetical protein